MSQHQFSFGFNANIPYELDVTNSPNGSMRVHQTFSLGGVRRAIHAWRTGTGASTSCVCVELTGHCPLPLHQVLAIQPGASGEYRIGTTCPATTTITGDAGTLRVGSTRGGGDGDGGDDPHRHR